MNPKHFHIIGNPENRRVKMFCEDAQKLGHFTTITSYLELIENVEERFVIPADQILRLESPGENAILNGAFLKIGGFKSQLMRGEVGAQNAWMAGFSQVLNRIEAQQYFLSPTDVLAMFDKREMHTRLQKVGCRTPEQLPHKTTLKSLKSNNKAIRAFIKPRFGSSASGVLACSINRDFVKCVTSLEIDGDRFFNSLKIQTYTGKDAEKCINFILNEGAIIERWVPKATLKNGAFDMRIVCIDGQAQHIVVRVSQSPMTNLHLGNQRGTLEEVEFRFGKSAIERAKAAAEIAASAFPDAHYLGVDVALNVSGKKAVVFEVNAFGDLLPGVLHNGMTTYGAEISALPAK